MTQAEKDAQMVWVFTQAMETAAENNDTEMLSDWYDTVQTRAESADNLQEMIAWLDDKINAVKAIMKSHKDGKPYPVVINALKQCKQLAATLNSL